MPPKVKKSKVKIKVTTAVAHEHLDQDWQALDASGYERREFRSLIYRLLGAVLAQSLREKGSDSIAGIIDPFAGDHHITKLRQDNPEYLDLIPRFMKYLRSGPHTKDAEGGFYLLPYLKNWFSNIRKQYQNKPRKDWEKIIAAAI